MLGNLPEGQNSNADLSNPQHTVHYVLMLPYVTDIIIEFAFWK